MAVSEDNYGAQLEGSKYEHGEVPHQAPLTQRDATVTAFTEEHNHYDKNRNDKNEIIDVTLNHTVGYAL